MKTPNPSSSKPAPETKRPFTWSISTTDVPFMQMSGAEAAMEGSSSCDCGAITRTGKPRQKRPGKTSGQ